jgi:hypothetical protein
MKLSTPAQANPLPMRGVLDRVELVREAATLALQRGPAEVLQAPELREIVAPTSPYLIAPGLNMSDKSVAFTASPSQL